MPAEVMNLVLPGFEIVVIQMPEHEIEIHQPGTYVFNAMLAAIAEVFASDGAVHDAREQVINTSLAEKQPGNGMALAEYLLCESHAPVAALGSSEVANGTPCWLRTTALLHRRERLLENSSRRNRGASVVLVGTQRNLLCDATFNEYEGTHRSNGFFLPFLANGTMLDTRAGPSEGWEYRCRHSSKAARSVRIL